MTRIRAWTPAKAFEVIIFTENERKQTNEEEVISYGSDMASLIDDFENASKKAIQKNKKDGYVRRVVLRQILLQRCTG